MLGNSNVVAMVAVSDLSKGKEFYGKKLGLKQFHENPGGVAYKSGTGTLFIYQAPTAGQNQATSASWEVKEIQKVVSELKELDILFEHYDLPQTELLGDVHVMMGGVAKAAWFKDPDGNILGLTEISDMPDSA